MVATVCALHATGLRLMQRISSTSAEQHRLRSPAFQPGPSTPPPPRRVSSTRSLSTNPCMDAHRIQRLDNNTLRKSWLSVQPDVSARRLYKILSNDCRCCGPHRLPSGQTTAMHAIAGALVFDNIPPAPRWSSTPIKSSDDRCRPTLFHSSCMKRRTKRQSMVVPDGRFCFAVLNPQNARFQALISTS